MLDSTGHAAPCPEPPRTNFTPPFAMLPHDIAADPRLTATDLRVLAALLYFARQDPSCYPSDFSLGERPVSTQVPSGERCTGWRGSATSGDRSSRPAGQPHG